MIIVFSLLAIMIGLEIIFKLEFDLIMRVILILLLTILFLIFYIWRLFITRMAVELSFNQNRTTLQVLGVDSISHLNEIHRYRGGTFH